MKSKLIVLAFLLISCSSNKVVVERQAPPVVSLDPVKHKTVEVRPFTGDNSESFRRNLIQYLTENSNLIVLETQSSTDLINGRLLGNRNRQNYKGADLIIKGSVSEEIKTNVLDDGSKQFFVTTRPQIDFIEADSGRVIFSKYFIGTSRSQIQRTTPAISTDVYTDAFISARNVAFHKFVSQFTPQKSWMEISLYETGDKVQFKKIRDLINHGLNDEALKVCEEELGGKAGEEKGKILFNMAVIESLRDQYLHAKALIKDSYQYYPKEEILKYLKKIEQMEGENLKVSMFKKGVSNE